MVRSYNHLGAEALGDMRRNNPGALPKLDDVQQANLLQAIRGVTPDGGLWNGCKVADYPSELLDIPVSRQQGWQYLKQMELRLRVPRPQHQETDLEEQEVWKKKLNDEVEQIKQQYPAAAVEIWCEDEHCIGLQPAERLWPLVNEPLINQAFESIKQTEEVVYQRCRRLLRQQELIRGLTSYHWLPIATTA